MSVFIIYVLVNIKLFVGCDNLSAPNRGQSIFYNTVQNTRIFNACILLAGCPNSITTYFLIFRQKLYGQPQRAYRLEYFQN